MRPKRAAVAPVNTSRWWSVRVKVNLAGAIILLAFAVGWWNGYRVTSRLSQGIGHVASFQDVLLTVRQASMSLFGVGTAHRSYLLSRDDKHLQAYRSRVAAYRQAVERLRQQTRDQGRQIARLDEIDRLGAAHFEFLDKWIYRIQSRGAEAALGEISQSGEYGYADEIIQLLSDLEDGEKQLGSARLLDAAASVRNATLILVVYGTFNLIGIIAAFVVFNQEITRQGHDEESLRQALKAADTASEAKTTFLATVSHEIRTPLNAVSGMSGLLLDTRLDPEQREFAEAVRTNAEALSMLLGDLLDSSRIEANQVFLEFAPFDVRELVEGVAGILVVRAEVKGVELVVDLAPDMPQQLVGDRNRLSQVLMNLVSNAVKFTESGEVRVSARSDRSTDGRFATLRLSVVDTGIGIPQELHATIFERFVQSSRSIVRNHGGMGLGLNISRSLMELMGGRISMTSELGHGTTFEAEVTLPLAPSLTPADFNATSLAGVEVLVIHPNQSQREAAVRLLSYAGASVQTVDAAGAALEHIARAGTPRVIVVGEHLPDSTGLDFAKALWHDRDGSESSGINVVLLCSLRAVASNYLGSYGISACVYKPVRQARLVQAVRQAAGLEVEREERVVEAEPVNAHGRILLVDDNRDNSKLATRILTSAGYDVDVAADGVKAVQSAAAFRYDLILMDVELPLIDGIEATRQIRAQKPEPGQPPVPIVALTAHAVQSVRDQAMSAGMSDYLTKPIQKGQLLDACSQWIDARPVILAADDSPESHVLLANYMGSDYRIVSTFNGQEAVEGFERQRVSLVLLDIDMPVMNGYDAARAIRRARGGDVVPIIALSGYDGPEERDKCLAAGCTAHLVKPVRRAELFARVTGLLRQDAVRRGKSSSGAVPPSTAVPGPSTEPLTGAALPQARDTANQARKLLALQDFDGLAALARTLAATARNLELNKLATVSEELANAARFEDPLRSAWWADQLAVTLGEAQRILEVRRSARTTAGGSYVSLARIATVLLGVPVASVTLRDKRHVHIQDGASLPSHNVAPVCRLLPSLAAGQQGPVLVEDGRIDPRLRETEAVTSHGVVAYAGVPLTSSAGVPIGSLCAMDIRPHRWPPEEVGMLVELASIAVRMFELERDIEQPAGNPAATAGPSAAEPAPTPVTVVRVDNDIVDLVPGYVANRRQDVAILRGLVGQADFDAIGRLGHRMKGSGESYGLPDVGRIGADLEQAAGRRDACGIGQAIDDLERTLSRLRLGSAADRLPLEA